MGGFSTEAHVALGVAFVLVGAAAAGLQYWLWTFPMGPDPAGQDPNGRTTAPPFWRGVHRCLGYLFVAIYFFMVVRMAPRAVFYVDRAWNLNAIAHVVAAVGVLLVVIPKVLILRKLQKYGKRLPLLGSWLLLLAAVIAGTGATPYAELRSRARPSGMSGVDYQATIRQVANRCNQCHGLSVVMGEDEDVEEWMDILEDMAENAEKRGMSDPAGGRRAEIAAVLATDGGGEDNGRRRRRRGRDD